MQPNWEIFQAMLHCHYKAWQIAKYYGQLTVTTDPNATVELPVETLTRDDKLVLTVLYINHPTSASSMPIQVLLMNGKAVKLKLKLNSVKARKLYTDTITVINEETPPSFYKNAHCPECTFHDKCYKKLEERNCISLLAGIPLKVILKFHKRGVYSIEQLSHLFRPRRKRRHPQAAGSYLWEIKALALTEQKTFVLYPPDVKETDVSVYLDFEGLPDEQRIYLIGVFIESDGVNKRYSFWANEPNEEKDIFVNLFALLKQYPDATIYHYGSYETRNLQYAQKRFPEFKNDITAISPRMFNLLGIIRTHIYPPVYGNGLKELAQFLKFTWSNPSADGKQSIQWRRNWEATQDKVIKEALVHK